MRSTIHLVSARDYPLMAEGVRGARRERWIRGHRGHAEPALAEAAAGRLRSILAGRVMSRSELMQQLEAESPVWTGAGLWIDLVRAPPSGTWEHRRADLYALADDWLGPANVAPDACREHLVRRYLAGFGPAPVADIASWAGLAPRAVASVVERMPLRRFRDEAGGVLLDLPRAPLPDAGTPAPVRFLPVWEAALLVHGRRTQILPERYRPVVFNTKTPHSVNTFLVDGRVAGTWRHVGRAVKVEPFEPLPRGAMRELEDEGRRLAEFLV
jgi:hypothetical protein